LGAQRTRPPQITIHYGQLHIIVTKEKVKIAADNRAFSSGITMMTNAKNLKFMNMESALNGLIEYSVVNILCLNRVTLDDDTGKMKPV
jgi:hypothetical protein